MKKFNFLTVLILLSFLIFGCEKQETIIDNYDVEDIQNQILTTLDKVEESVVAVKIYNAGYTDNEDNTDSFIGHGSGLIFKKDDNNNYYIVTNAHVTKSGFVFEIYTENDGIEKTYKADLLGEKYENYIDLAVLRINTTDNLKVTPLENDSSKEIKLNPGQYVIAIGTPLSLDYFNYVTYGIISKVDYTSIYHDAAINSGNSGGPLFNLNGDFIGINTSKYAELETEQGTMLVEGIGRAIPYQDVIDNVDEILTNNDTPIERPKLGIAITNIQNYLINNPDISINDLLPEDIESESASNYVIIAEVNEGVAKGLLQKKDIIYKRGDNTIINNASEFQEYLWEHKIGDKFIIYVIRNQQETKVEITL